MTKTPAVRILLAGFALMLAGVASAHAQAPSPATMLDPKLGPKFDDVNITVPTPEELKSCTVEIVKGALPNTSGFVLKDAKGQLLRKYFDTTGKVDGTGRTKIDMWSYYKDGVEVYREFDTAGKGIPNNFRWLNSGGMKWGVGGLDPKTGRWAIHSWRMISAPEVGFEVFQAVAKNDANRLNALFITEAEMQMIKLPASKMKEVAALQQQAPQKFAALVAAVKLSGAKFDGVEGAIPNCDTKYGDGDVPLIKFPSRAIRYEGIVMGQKKFGWIHTGEMIQVGMAWRIVDAPSDDGAPLPPPVAKGVDPRLEQLLKDLEEHDKLQTKLSPAGILTKKADVEAYYAKRVELLLKIIPLAAEADRENWYRQLFDNMTAQAQNSGAKMTMDMLTKMKDDMAAAKPGSDIAAYAAYREMWTRYAVGMASITEQKKIAELQEKWLDDLSAFVGKYSKAEDTPDALGQAAIGCEFAGKIEQAKRWYKELSTSFPDHHYAARARGSLARLNLVGNPMVLSAPMLADSSKMFNIAQLKSKVVIVHYWSTAAANYQNDFAILGRIMATVGAKNDVALVCVNLDSKADDAKTAVVKANIQAIHLFQATNNDNGMNSPLATQYGIHILPTLFMVGRDGRVTSNSLQIGDIETELKKVQ